MYQQEGGLAFSQIKATVAFSLLSVCWPFSHEFVVEAYRVTVTINHLLKNTLNRFDVISIFHLQRRQNLRDSANGLLKYIVLGLLFLSGGPSNQLIQSTQVIAVFYHIDPQLVGGSTPYYKCMLLPFHKLVGLLIRWPQQDFSLGGKVMIENKINLKKLVCINKNK